MTEKHAHQNPLPAPKQEEEDDSYAQNYAMAIALGLPFGMLFGLIVLDNMVYGLLAGLALAPIIGLFMGKWNER